MGALSLKVQPSPGKQANQPVVKFRNFVASRRGDRIFLLFVICNFIPPISAPSSAALLGRTCARPWVIVGAAASLSNRGIMRERRSWTCDGESGGISEAKGAWTSPFATKQEDMYARIACD